MTHYTQTEQTSTLQTQNIKSEDSKHPLYALTSHLVLLGDVWSIHTLYKTIKICCRLSN